MNRQIAVVFARTMLAVQRAPTQQAVHDAARAGLRQLRAIPAVPPELVDLVHKYRDERLHHGRAANDRHFAGNGGDFRLLQASGLTRRECEVLRWLADGKRDRDIATILGIAVRTVRKHVEHIRAKLHVETRMAAVACAQHVLRRRGPERSTGPLLRE